MPTGYTDAVLDGKVATLREYALRCSRAFGVMYDHGPLDMVIPDVLPTEDVTRYATKAHEAQSRLDELEKLKDVQIVEQAELYNAGRRLEAQVSEDVRIAKLKRAKDMIAEVETWVVFEAHAKLKKFMLDQLRETIDFDSLERPAPLHCDLDPKAWFEYARNEAEHTLAFYQRLLLECRARAAQQQGWLDDLRASLPAPAEVHDEQASVDAVQAGVRR